MKRGFLTAAPNESRLHAVGGWLIGFSLIPVVIPSMVLFSDTCGR